MTNKEYVKCYNCNKPETKIRCGFARYGCNLCRTYGNSVGFIEKKYKNKILMIENKIYNPSKHNKQ